MPVDRPHALHLVPPATPAQGERTDDELLERARGGERAAFEAIVRRHQNKVVSFAIRFFGQRAVALDVAQEVFLDVLKALPRYRAEGRFHVYLYRITMNRCRMTARTVRYEDRARERLWADSPNEPAIAPDLAAERERQRRLLLAMRELPEKQRAVVQLRFWGGLSHEEIAEALDTKEGTVKSRLWNALATLRVHLGDAIGEEDLT